ncbi:alpha/beta fold hydrolase [Pseudonocardia asaccharolytica]|uniref:AB hydrolase-1 domain-containing protein n=1 Tax=Pseudonocardia asaccharolytica DSM 44247 = NBRC 16224 TaxID=1123024 RepID=A0A511D4N4_9PSEU|nr:alpha/beta fold hydrolase [Pseudonocardia asaccharolytica]GEL19752.1 hypothetical protein PA7_35890 [Pseudonocardia asaccharolytica DSM 44247 = NBRC 16224]
MNPLLKGREVEFYLTDSGARFVIAYTDMADAAREGAAAAGIETLVVGPLDGRVDVLGVSWGGGLAQQFAFQNPRRCRRLVLVATSTGALMIPGRPEALPHLLTPRRHRDPAYARRVAGLIYGGSLSSRDRPRRPPPSRPRRERDDGRISVDRVTPGRRCHGARFSGRVAAG